MLAYTNLSVGQLQVWVLKLDPQTFEVGLQNISVKINQFNQHKRHQSIDSWYFWWFHCGNVYHGQD